MTHPTISLAGTIVDLHSGKRFVDGKDRVTLRIDNADFPDNRLMIPTPDGAYLDQRYVVILTAVAAGEQILEAR